MDVDWARGRLESYLQICDEIAEHQRQSGGVWDETCTALNNRAVESLATVSKIVKLVDPGSTTILMPPAYATNDSARVVRQALGALRDHADWEVRLAPESPSILATELHPLIWRAASVVWATGEYRLATQQAAVALSAQVKSRVGSTLSERKLAQQVFSTDPPKRGQSRLHLPGDPADETWLSRQQGLHLLAQGAFAGIRNVAVHSTSPLSEHEGLEYLAVLSVVARWADETELVSIA